MITSKLMHSVSAASLIISIFLGVSSSSAFVVWFMMEVNLFCFLALAFSAANTAWEVVPKYFIVQSLSSAGILLTLLLSDKMDVYTLNAIFMLLLLLKLGGWPFYSWFVVLSNHMNKEVLFIFFTVQKILPIYLFCFISMSALLVTFITLNAFSSAILVVQTSSLNALLAFSSMFNLSWMMAVSSNFSLVMIFLLSYMINLWPLLSLLSPNTKVSMNAFAKFNFKNLVLFSMFAFALMGVPPSLTFFMKISMLSYMQLNVSTILSLSLLALSSFFIYAYSLLVVEGLSMTKEAAQQVVTSNFFYLFFFVAVWVIPAGLVILEDSM